MEKTENLKCEEFSCLYNGNTYCMKKHIAIDENSICASYTSKNSVDYANEFANDFSLNKSNCPSIHCEDCECCFNEQKACQANKVTVAKQAFQSARCLTFKARQ